MSPVAGASAYRSTQTTTASPARTLVLLLEAALAHMRAAATLYEKGESAAAHPRAAKASEIVHELIATLDPKPAPELAEHLGAAYSFVVLRLLEAQTQSDPQAAHEAAAVFAPIALAFADVVEAQ